MMQNSSKVFSLPINPKVDSEFVKKVLIPFLKNHSKYIFDLYFTCRMPPFNQDAMGDIFTNPQQTTFDALYVSESTGIPLSATFNNIWVRPTQENLDIFIQNFRFLYERGIRIATIPHTSWLLTGQIQNEFPELFIKNTILREVTRPNEIVSLAKAGFHYINLDRDLMRDKNQLLKIKEAKDYCESIGKPIKLSLLANENCWGGCPIMPEHYQYNSTRVDNEPPFFGNSISRISCSTWDVLDSSTSLKAANLPPWKEDWEEFFDLGIDVFKMHGRESAMRLKESMDIISEWKNNSNILYSNFNSYIEDTTLNEKPIDIWRDKIKTCGFDCWKCNYCESVVESRLRKQDRLLHPYVKHTIDSLDKSAMKKSNFIEDNFDIEGLSSNRVRHFLNNLCSIDNSVYLEIGSHTGSTFIPAVMGNKVESYAVDSFEEQNISPARDDLKWNPVKNPKKDLLENIKRYNINNTIVFNCRATELTHFNFVNEPNILFYDGSHDFEEQYINLNHIIKLMSDTFILVVDDANFKDVIPSIKKTIKDKNLTPLYENQILTPIIEDSTSWWNGLFIGVFKK